MPTPKGEGSSDFPRQPPLPRGLEFRPTRWCRFPPSQHRPWRRRAVSSGRLVAFQTAGKATVPDLQRLNVKLELVKAEVIETLQQYDAALQEAYSCVPLLSLPRVM